MRVCPNKGCDGEIDFVKLDLTKLVEVWECDRCCDSWHVPLVQDFDNIRKVQG
jgi:hypothetical protein